FADILKASESMPLEVAARLAPTLTAAAKAGTLWVWFDDACTYCARLPEGGKSQPALALAQALFPLGKGIPRYARDEYWYKEGLRKVTPPLVRANAKKYLPMLRHWLCQAIQSK